MLAAENTRSLKEFIQQDPVGLIKLLTQVQPMGWQAAALETFNTHPRLAIRSGHGVGKAQCKSLILNTPEGEKRWGDLEIGDSVFGADGHPTRVIGVYEQPPNQDVFRVTFDDGSYTDVSGPHLWNVRGRRERRKKLTSWRTLSTEELLEIGVKRRNGTAMARQWEIPMQGPAGFDEREVDLHPYFVGVWLGDGSKGCPSWGKPYPEVKEKVESLGYCVHTTGSRSILHRIQNVSHLINSSEAFNKGSHERYIPEEYKYNSVENRMALFEGLCDSDGECLHTGQIEYSTTSLQLAEDVVWLARSLGCKAMLRPTVKKGRYRNESGELVECRDCYRIGINAPFNPFSIPHKRDRFKPSEHRYTSRWVDSIEWVGKSDEMMCIEVEAEDGLYLTNDFIATHNSTLLAWSIIIFILQTVFEGKEAKILCTAPTSPQLKIVLWAEINKWIRKLEEPWRGYFHITNEFITVPGKERQIFATARTAKKDQPEALQGMHAERVLFILDEASGIPDIVFEYGGGSLSTEGAKVIMAGNPTRNSGYFYEAFHKDKALWQTMRVSGLDVPLVSEDYTQSIIRKYGKDSNVYRVRVLGEFPREEDDVVIPLELVEAAAVREPPEIAYQQPLWGLDVARFGNCRTALSKRAGNVLYEPVKTWAKRDTMEVGGLIQHEVYECESDLREPFIIVDAIGVGAGVADWLKHYGEKLVGVRGLNVSETPARPGFMRMRDQIWWATREWFENREACIPNDPDLMGELCSLKYKVSPNGKIKVQGKEDLLAEGRDSPDSADSFVLTHCPMLPKKRKRRRETPYRGSWMGA